MYTVVATPSLTNLSLYRCYHLVRGVELTYNFSIFFENVYYNTCRPGDVSVLLTILLVSISSYMSGDPVDFLRKRTDWNILVFHIRQHCSPLEPERYRSSYYNLMRDVEGLRHRGLCCAVSALNQPL